MSEIEKKLGIVPLRSSRERAVEALKRIGAISPPPTTQSSARAIAGTMADSIVGAITASAPYGREVDVEMNVARQEADGSMTTAQLKLKCGGYRQ